MSFIHTIQRWSKQVHWRLFVGLLGATLLLGCPSGTSDVREVSGTSKVYQLRRQLRSTDAAERKSAADQLGAMGVRAEKAITALRQALLDGQPNVRMAAVAALGKIGFKAVPALLYARGRRDPAMQKSASAAINRLGPERKQALIEALKSPLTSVKVQASSLLGDMGPSAKDAIPALSKMLKDDETDARVAAADGLRRIGPTSDNANVVMALGAALKANKMWWNVRVAISKTLGSYKGKGAAAAPELIPLLSSKDTNVNKAAFDAFVAMGPSTVDAMKRGYPNAPWEGKVRMAQIVEKFGPKAKGMVATLASGLRDSDTDVRKAILKALSTMGKAGQPALPGLTKLLVTPRVFKQNWLSALRTMLAVGDQGVLALQQLLEGKNWQLRKKIVEGLGQLGAKVGGQGVPILISAIQHKEKEVRWIAAMTLRKLKADAAPAVSALAQALTSPDTTTRKLAAKALGAIGSPAKSAIPALKKRRGDASGEVQAAARDAIAAIEKGAASPSKRTPARRAPAKRDPNAPTPPRNIP